MDETLEQLARFGRKMARVQKHFADEDADHELDASEAQTSGKQEWRRLRAEYRELTGDLKAALREKIDAPTEEKARVLEILRSALAAIRQK